MITTVVLLSLFSVAASAALYYSVKKNLELIETLENTMEQTEKSVEILDYYYKRLDRKLKLEVMSDDPTIKELVEDMKQSRKAVLEISKQLTGEDLVTEDSE